MKETILNVFLVAVSLLAGMGLSEGILRMAKPELASAARSGKTESRWRIFQNPKNSQSWAMDPDTGARHAVAYNNLGGRQSRNFSLEKSPGVFRIGVFGDSFTENVHLPVEYSFTEPLDYLLNRTGRAFEVLNLGTSSYGTDQVYLQYMDEGRSLSLDLVVYVCFQNDLVDILANDLVDLSGDGSLLTREARPGSLPRRLARNLYLTYFLLEAAALWREENASAPERAFPEKTRLAQELDRVFNRGGEEAFDQRAALSAMFGRALAIYRGLTAAMRDEAGRRGSRFLVVFVPSFSQESRMMKQACEELDIPWLDLLPAFANKGRDLSRFFFRNDPHWNALGNRMAAREIFSRVVCDLGISSPDPGRAEEGLDAYYRSFGRGSTADSEIRRRYMDREDGINGSGEGRAEPVIHPGGRADKDRWNLELALLNMKQGLWVNAEERVALALAFNPENALAHDAMGRLLLRRRNFPEAARHLELAVSLCPEDAGMKARREEALRLLKDVSAGPGDG